MGNRVYKIGLDATGARNAPTVFDFYGEAVEAKKKIEEQLGVELKVFKIEITEATHVTEDYREW